jgi:hypothetical protein
MPRKRRVPNAPYNTGRPPLNEPAPGRAYGERQKAERALQAVPIQPANQPVDFAQILEAAKRSPQPNGGLLNQPTARPNEPVTAGLSTGPGPGPEVLGPADPDLANLRPLLPVLVLMAAQPNASVSARNFVRRLRGAMPPQ